MANAMYSKGKQNILNGNIDLNADTIKVVCVDAADYTINLSTHDALDDIPGAARVATSGALASKTFTDGTFDAADVTISAVSGDQFELLILYKDSGVEATSYLICAFDTATGLAFTPSGGDLTINWNASGIFTW
jgi:hypothetical protein